jgi:adenylate cyclase class 2
MPTEIEAKIHVEDHEPVRARLRECGAHHVGDAHEVNQFFDTPERSLLARDMGLRLRRTRDAATGREKFIVTSKGPAGSGTLKHRDELEFSVSDADAATRLFERLGYRPDISFEKRRQSWEVEGCHVELDELPRLGRFVEIEGPGEDVIQRVRDKLGLSQRPLAQQSYIAMVAALLNRPGVTTRALTFA